MMIDDIYAILNKSIVPYPPSNELEFPLHEKKNTRVKTTKAVFFNLKDVKTEFKVLRIKLDGIEKDRRNAEIKIKHPLFDNTRAEPENLYSTSDYIVLCQKSNIDNEIYAIISNLKSRLLRNNAIQLHSTESLVKFIIDACTRVRNIDPQSIKVYYSSVIFKTYSSHLSNKERKQFDENRWRVIESNNTEDTPYTFEQLTKQKFQWCKY